eukprot:1144463-Pelagomonas_calceolata.AAC.2
MRARVWAAGGLEANVRKINPNFQDVTMYDLFFMVKSGGQFVDMLASCGYLEVQCGEYADG